MSGPRNEPNPGAEAGAEDAPGNSSSEPASTPGAPLEPAPTELEPDAAGPQKLEDVLSVGSDVLRTALHGAGSDIDFEQLEGVFQSAQSAMVATSPGSTQTRPSTPAPARKPVRTPEGHEGLTAESLALRITELDQSEHEELDLDELRVSQEQLSILLQMLLVASNEAVAVAVANRLSQITPADRAQVQDLCQRALVDLAEKLPFETFDLVFPAVGNILRLDVEVPLLETLPRLARTCSERAREALWPHAVDELLRHQCTAGQPVGAGPLRFLDELPQHAMPRAVARLCKLPSLAHKKLAKDAFDTRELRSFRLFAHLLLSPRAGLVGPAILATLKSGHVEIEGAASLLVALDRYKPEHAEFLSLLLLDLPNGTASEALSNQTRTLLAPALRSLDPGRRKEPWIPAAIAYLGQEDTPSTRSTLERIRRHRSWIGLHAWPSRCRKQAKRALDMTRQQESSHGR